MQLTDQQTVISVDPVTEAIHKAVTGLMKTGTNPVAIIDAMAVYIPRLLLAATPNLSPTARRRALLEVTSAMHKQLSADQAGV